MTNAQTWSVPEFVESDRMRKAREHAQLEQAELAHLMGVSRETVSNYERGRVKPRRIVRNAWALATGVPVAWLESGVVPPDDSPQWAPRDSNSQPTVLMFRQAVTLVDAA